MPHSECGGTRVQVRDDYGLDQGRGSGYEKYLGVRADRLWNELPVGYGQKGEGSVKDE